MFTLKESEELGAELDNYRFLLQNYPTQEITFPVDNVLEEYDDAPYYCIKGKIDGKVFYKYETNNKEMADMLLKRL